MKFTLTLIIPLSILLSGCSKMMNENECVAADWQTVGFLDGSAGRAQTYLERRAEACAEYGVTPDLNQYLAGRDRGLESYCEPRSGFYMGLRNTVYLNVCPRTLEPAFLNAYQDGSGLRARQNRITELESAINASLADMDQLEEDIANATLAIAAPNTPNQDRLNLAIDIKKMAEARGNIEANLPVLDAELTAAQVDLQHYSDSIAPKYPGAI